MTPIFSMVLVIAVVIAVSLVVIIIRHALSQKKAERLLTSFAQEAGRLNLSITEQLVLGNRMIGYDKGNNKLLFVALNRNSAEKYIVDLEEVRSCMVIKSYGPIKAQVELGAIVTMIALQLNYKNGAEPFHIPFYIKTIDPVSEIKQRAEQAKSWRSLLSVKMPIINIKEKGLKIRQVANSQFVAGKLF